MGALKDILSITGYSELFKFVSQSVNGIIVESMETGKRMKAFANQKLSSLDDIAIYTDDKEVSLKDVFKKIREKTESKECISYKADEKELKAYFESILPNYDKDRVYISDIKKVMKWYNMLVAHNLLDLLDKEDDANETSNSDSHLKFDENKKTGKFEGAKSEKNFKKIGKTTAVNTPVKK